jgi:hypothetical protein
MDLSPRNYIEPAQAAADRAGVDWQMRASELFLWVLRRSGKPMLCEEVAATVHPMGLPKAPDQRAWGAVTTRLARQRFIERVGYAPAHDGAPKSLWKAA